jgi:hypothetical protein
VTESSADQNAAARPEPVPRARLVLASRSKGAAEAEARRCGPAIVREVTGGGFEVWALGAGR